MSKLNQNMILASSLYNHINIPSSAVLKCSCCENQETQKHLQQQFGSGYFCIPDRYVDIFVCNFCKKIDQPKCTYCWQARPCCENRQKVLYKEFFGFIKKEILSSSMNLTKTMKNYVNLPTRRQQFSPSSQIFNQLILALNKTQKQIKQQINDQILRKNEKVVEKYNSFQEQLIQKIRIYTYQERNESQTGDKQRNSQMSLVQCYRVLKQMQEFNVELQQYAYKECDQYLERVDEQYRMGLWNRIQREFRVILTPAITYKSQSPSQNCSKSSLSSSSNSSNEIDRLQLVVKKLQLKLSEALKMIGSKQGEIQSLSHKIAMLTSNISNPTHQNKTNNILIKKIQQQSINPIKNSKHQQTISNKSQRRQLKKNINTSQIIINRQKSTNWLEDVVNQMAS